MDTSYAADARSVAQARGAVARLAGAGGAGTRDLERIRLVVSEAVTNAVVHAYGGGGGTIQVTASVEGGELAVVVADDGCGMGSAPGSAGLGMGLALMSRESDGMTVTTRASGGTLVELRFRLAAAASQDRGSVSSATSPA
jgi:stage II sporulation protein AB (anti-sigma F factor)